MMRSASTPPLGLGALLFGLALSAGCTTLLTTDLPTGGASPLRIAQASSEAVTLDIYWATLPNSIELSGDDLWRFVQEDRLDERLRARLMRNGLRAGVVGGAPPEQITRLLNPLGSKVEEGSGKMVGTLAEPTGVSRSTKQLRPGKPVTIQASGALESAPMLIATGDRLTGERFTDVQPIYNLSVLHEPGKGYRLIMTPELHQGEARMQWNSDATGMMSRGFAQRDRRVFSDLQIEAPLVVGEMLIVTSVPGTDSRLGNYFHRAESDAPGERKAILIRLTHAPSDAFEVAKLH